MINLAETDELVNRAKAKLAQAGVSVNADDGQAGPVEADWFKQSGAAFDARRSMADRLIDYALADEPLLFVDQHGAPHALVNGQPVLLNSRCYDWLSLSLWEREAKSASGEALARASQTLRAMAKFGGETRTLHVRSAWHDDALYVELDAGKVIRIDASGWKLDPEPRVMFRRFVNLKPLPTPKSGGTLGSLLELLPLRSERDRRLLLAYAACGLLPHVARPILLTTGAMGSGKTTLHRIVKRLLDPTTPETIRIDPRDALQKAAHCAVVLCDNLSGLSDWQVNAVCRWVTGEGDSKRVLYTDDDDFIVEIKRLVLLNGINPPADRADFLDRCLCVELERIPDDRRKAERDIWAAFDLEHARWLGCLFDLLSAAMRRKEKLRLSRLPRLADWGEWMAAVYEAAGWGVETFFADWSGNVEAQQTAVLDGSTFAQVVLAFMSDKNEWTGTPSDLLSALQKTAESQNLNTKSDRKFPATPDWLWRRLREILPLLTSQGIEASRPRRGKVRDITLRKGVKSGDDSDEPSKRQELFDDTIQCGDVNGDVNGDDEKCHENSTNDTNNTSDTIFADKSASTEAADEGVLA